MVTMTAIDEARREANKLLDQVRAADKQAASHHEGPSALKEALWLQDRYDLTLIRIGNMLREYHAIIDAAAAKAAEALR